MSVLRPLELNRATYPELRERVECFQPTRMAPRSYPGYPTYALPRCRARAWPSLDRTLVRRRSSRGLSETPPSSRILARILQFAHGVCAPDARGPVPSAGGLQALELYVAMLSVGVYHYDRAAHRLACVRPEATRDRWRVLVPSMEHLSGGSLLWIVVGDGARVEPKYAERGYRFLLLEAGHLMQNLCLLSASVGRSTVPLGGCLEPDIAREIGLLPTDVVLYVALS